jgi:hypothetical protein
VILAEFRLLPRFLTPEVEAYFEWEATNGFKTFYLRNRQTGEADSSGRIQQYIVAIQIKPRLRGYFEKVGWQRINGHVGLQVAKMIPVAVPVALGSDGEVLYDPDETPLMHAADKGDDTTVQRLVSAGVDVNARDQRGQTALIHACLRGNSSPDLVRALVSGGADVNARDGEGRTALFLEVQMSKIACGTIAELLTANADVNAKDKKGNTVLMMAASFADSGTVEALLTAGADPNARNDEGQTALSLADAKHNSEIAEILRHGESKGRSQ